MELTLYLYILFAFFFAAFVKGVTGLGFSTTCLAILALGLGVKGALPLVIIPSVTSNIITMRAAGHFRETVFRFWPMLLATIPGLLLGLWLLSSFDKATSGAVLGFILMIYAIFALIQPDVLLPGRLEKPLFAPVGVTTGIVNGMTGSQVMPVLPFLMSLNMDNNRFVQALNCSFTLSSIIMAAGLYEIGYLTTDDLLLSCTGLLFVFLGVYAGNAIRQRLSPLLFKRTVLIVLLILGAGLVGRFIWGA